jgi:hypothetical protein
VAYNSTIINKKKILKCGCFDYAFSRGSGRVSIHFEVPFDDMGDADFFSEMHGKYLIRYIKGISRNQIPQ